MTFAAPARRWATATLLALVLCPAAATAAGASAPGPAISDPGNIMGPKPGPGKAPAKAQNPYGTEPQVLSEGRRLFVWFNCYGCHGGRAGGGMGPSLRDAAWLYGREDQDIFNSIAEGRPHGMPAWGTVLPDSQIWKLTAYIRSLNEPYEPKPPPPNPSYPDPPPRRDIKGATAGGGPN